jgi:hypothetical protein
MPLQATSGAASQDGFGGNGVPIVPQYIEDVFSTYLYTGNGSGQAIPNGINLGSTYGGSGFFEASNYLTVPASSNWEFTGDYTIEAWIYLFNLNNGTIYGTGGSGSADQFTYTSIGELYFANVTPPAGTITAGSWIHVAVARSGSTQKIFVNGVALSTETVSGTIGQNATAYIGRRVDATNYVNGYISNLRVVKGTAVYTSNFTPSTAPLTAISGTVLLTCQANGFVDASTNAYTITNNNAIANTSYGPFISATAGKGGLVWTKIRSSATYGNSLQDTNRGAGNNLASQTTNAQINSPTTIQSFNTSGYTIGAAAGFNLSAGTFVSWTFRKQPKFFDIVTWVGDGTLYNLRTINHSLGCVPGCVMVKAVSATGNWFVSSMLSTTSAYGVPNRTWTSHPEYFGLNTNNASYGVAAGGRGSPSATDFTDTTFNLAGFGELGTIDAQGGTNLNGVTYIAYLFAHNAGGFGLTGTDNVISCGSFTTTTGGVADVNLGYEPQWVMMKSINNSASDWEIYDVMRGSSNSGSSYLSANTTSAEGSTTTYRPMIPTATGFTTSGWWSSGLDMMYIAIRRGPMKLPTSGASVLAAVTRTGTGGGVIIKGASSPPDLVVVKSRSNATEFAFTDRLRGVTKELSSSYTFSEADFGANPTVSINMNGWTAPAGYGTFNQSAYTYVDYMFSRYRNVFDEVCYTGTGSATTVTHNLAAVPELIIVKSRNGGAENWRVYYGVNQAMALNLTGAGGTASPVLWNDTAPTSSVFSVGTSTNTNGSGYTYVAYLFATLAGISKVGTYTGTGTSQVINCGFTTGARWVLIKRTDSTGDWYVWDTARGMVSGTDPYMIMNDALAETNANYVFTSSTGFTIQSGVPSAINANGGTFIFLAIA